MAYTDEAFSGSLTVRAIGPGGTAARQLGISHSAGPPRVLSVTTTPTLPKDGGFLRLPAGAGTVVFHVRRLDLPVDERFGRRYDWSEVARAYEDGLSARECRNRFGCSRQTWADAIRRGDIRPRCSDASQTEKTSK